MKNRTIIKNLVTVVTVMAVTLLTGCEKKEVAPEDPNLEWGYWEVTAHSPYIKIKGLSGKANSAEYFLWSDKKSVKLGYKVFHTIIITCTDGGGNPNTANGCAFTVNGDFYNISVRLERGVHN